MSDPKPKKTLDQITQDVLNSQFGISDADLSLLFEDPSTDLTPSPTPATTTPSVETVTEPVEPEPETTPVVTPAPVIPAPIIPSATPPEPSRPVEPVPDKSKDVESSLTAQKEQIAQMQALLQELLKRSQAPETAKPVATDPNVDIDDQQIIEKPKETITKLVQGILKVVLPAAFSEYDTEISKRQTMDEFRRTHKDFDELRPIMRQIVLENPTVNNDVSALPRVYQEAKDRKAAMLESMRRELNIPIVPVTPAPAASVQPALSEEDMLAKLEQRIVEKIRKRRAALAATSPTGEPVLPVARMTPIQKEAPKTEADIMFEAMLKAGVPSTDFLRNVETVKK